MSKYRLAFEPGAILRMVSVLVSRRLTRGRFVNEAEDKLGARIGKETVVCDSGTDALEIALSLYSKTFAKAKKGKVAIPALCYEGLASCVMRVGFEPVLVEVGRDMQMDVEDLVHVSRMENIVGVVPVHLAGFIGDVTRLGALCDVRGWFMIEDACQAFGSERYSRAAGTFGDLAAFSFYATKVVASGEGGAVVGHSDFVRMMRHQGRNESGEFVRLGWNSHMDELTAAYLCASIDSFFRWRLKHRRKLMREYEKRLAGCKLGRLLRDKNTVSNGYKEVFIANSNFGRCKIEDAIRSVGMVPETPVYRRLVCEHKLYLHLDRKSGGFPVAFDMSRNHVCLPLSDTIGTQDVKKVCDAILSVR